MKNLLPTLSLARLCTACAGALLLCSCAAPRFNATTAGPPCVGKVDFRQAPELKDLAGHARDLGNELYPKICALLLDETAKPPRRFDLILKPLKSRNTGEAHLEVKRIYLNSEYLTNKADRLEHFDKVFVHEMTHMAVQYRHWTKSLWSYETPASYWGESIADYAVYKLIGTNGWSCPECNIWFPHYTSGYTCGGAFLLYLETSYGADLVRRLVAEWRRHSCTDAFFTTATGKSLDDLWAEFRKTRAFKAGALEAHQLRVTLGYVNGLPPKDAVARFDKLVDQHADAFIRKSLGPARRKGAPARDIRALMALYLYLAQPGGSSEGFLFNLREKGELPGMAKGEKGWASKMASFDDMSLGIFPVSRTVDCEKKGEDYKLHYSVARTSRESDWKLEKAWRSTLDGELIEEFPVP